AERDATAEWLAELSASRRAVRVRIAGEERWLAAEDAGRVRDALGVALPVGLPTAYLGPVADPLGDLVARYARTHGPFPAARRAAERRRRSRGGGRGAVAGCAGAGVRAGAADPARPRGRLLPRVPRRAVRQR